MADTYTVHLPENPEPSLGSRLDGTMCIIGCHCQSPVRNSLVVLHNSEEMLVMQKRQGRQRQLGI